MGERLLTKGSSDNAWVLGDVFLGKATNSGSLNGAANYTSSLTTNSPSFKEGYWRIIVIPDLYNEMYEGPITYIKSSRNLSPSQANIRSMFDLHEAPHRLYDVNICYR